MTRALLLLALLGSSTACVTYERGRLEAASTRELPLALTVVQETAQGRSCGDWFKHRFKLAIDAALQAAPGANALADVSYHFEGLCVVVRGRAVRVEPPK
jgi:hypothetical protein